MIVPSQCRYADKIRLTIYNEPSTAEYFRSSETIIYFHI